MSLSIDLVCLFFFFLFLIFLCSSSLCRPWELRCPSPEIYQRTTSQKCGWGLYMQLFGLLGWSAKFSLCNLLLSEKCQRLLKKSQRLWMNWSNSWILMAHTKLTEKTSTPRTHPAYHSCLLAYFIISKVLCISFEALALRYAISDQTIVLSPLWSSMVSVSRTLSFFSRSLFSFSHLY